ncbi:amino acid ABC transporter substrate-binding protein [Paludibacterium purpuratum]|uniref:Amino acid ABC transporter substrate-binding protein (PAAT family) n=1 Tax=Paludibacterium purpuratum TaxID=1144873 RepID=A0A4R7B952_9NEIS|nr:amino acid ABC transporter substrate-binding protein [Paludibacterium purpuratum]TDR80216.1 amino acid ABC transporter substrate-binding protein (PAAT family) [Paludibacterium purpuratum]
MTRLLAFLLLALALPVSAQEALAQIRTAGVLKIGTEGDYPPFTYHDAAGQLVGFDVELAQAVAQQLGVKAQFVEGRWDGLIAGLDVARYDVVVNEVSISAARQAKYDFSQPYIVSRAALIVRNDNTSIKSFADLKGKKSPNSLTSNFAKLAKDNGAEVIPVQGFNESVEFLVSGRADATINDSLSFLDFKRHQPTAPLKAVAYEQHAESAGIVLRKGNPGLLDAVNRALAQIRADGTYRRISLKYFGQDVSR